MFVQTLSEKALADLQEAKIRLENPGLAAKLSQKLGTYIETGVNMLPENAQDIISTATREALEKALSVAIFTLKDGQRPARNWLHKGIVAGTGAVGGAFSLAGLAVELPFSTAVMLRSIADIARSEGESLKSPEARLACMEVFAYGGGARESDAVESGYFAVRAALAKAAADAAEYIATGGVVRQTAPPLVRFIAKIAARFGMVVTDKAVAQVIPVLGAAGGAAINMLFIDHFQSVARGHCIVRRLERTYDPEQVKEAYLNLRSICPQSASGA